MADNTGYVTRFDTLSWSKQASVAVGSNPAALAGANGLLYVSISDGYNSSGGYANGFRVVRLDPRTLQKRDEIKVGMNPGELCADANGTVYVVCRGAMAQRRRASGGLGVTAPHTTTATAHT